MSRIKSQKIKSVNDQTMIVTLDIGKGSHYGYFRIAQLTNRRKPYAGGSRVIWIIDRQRNGKKLCFGKLCARGCYSLPKIER